MKQSTDVRSNTLVASETIFMKNLSNNMLATLSPTQTGFVISMRTVPTDLSGQSLLSNVAELFPPAHLFGKEIRDTPGIWVGLRNFLDSRGASPNQHSSRRVILTVAQGLYNEGEDREAAVELANLIIANGHRIQMDLENNSLQPVTMTDQTSSAPSTQESYTNELVAHNVAMRLKEAAQKFS